MTAFSFVNATQALPVLLDHVMDKGHDTDSRNGKCREVIMTQVTLREPFPFEITTPGRHGSLPAQIAETMWILAGRNDVDWLSNYLPRAKDFSDDGKTWHGGYGPRIRAWDANEDNLFEGVDQLAHVVELLKADPNTRRAVVQIYNPTFDAFSADVARKDIPCNNWIHFLPRDGVLHAHVAIRSNDLMWGWSGINHFEWAAIQHIVAGLVGMEQGSLTFSISSLHLYEPHWDKAKRLIRANKGTEVKHFGVGNDTFDAGAAQHSVEGLDALVKRWFAIELEIRSNGPSKQVEYAIDRFPEVMMKQWLKVLYSWWHGQTSSPKYFQGSSMGYALENSPKRKQPLPPLPAIVPGSFTEFVANLHSEKHAVYGDSWMKRGEMLGIMANLARKVDRLGVGGAGDTPADTAIDLLCYALKYRLWLCANAGAPLPAPFVQGKHFGGSAKDPLSGVEHAETITKMLQFWSQGQDQSLGLKELIHVITESFDDLEHLVTEKREDRYKLLDLIIRHVYPLAVRLWNSEQPVKDLDPLMAKVNDLGAAALKARSNDTRRWAPEEGSNG